MVPDQATNDHRAMTTPDTPPPPPDEDLPDGATTAEPTDDRADLPPVDDGSPTDEVPPHADPPPDDGEALVGDPPLDDEGHLGDPPPDDGEAPVGDPPLDGGAPPHDGPPAGDSPPWDPPPGPTAPPPYRGRSLDRRSRDRVVSGVAGGLGDYFNVDPAIFRLAFVGLSIFGGGVGLVLYGLGWVFLPERDTGRAIGEGVIRRLGGGRSAGGALLLIVAVLVVVGNASGGNGLFWAALLVGVGVLLFREGDDPGDGARGGGGGERPSSSMWSEAPPPQPPTPTPTEGSGRVATAPLRTDMNDTQQTVRDDVYAPPSQPVTDDGWRPSPYTAPDPPAPPSVLGRVTVAAALIMIGAVALLDTLTRVDVAFPSYAALALTVVGAGLLVGARWGRARGLIALGVVALLVLTAASTITRLPAGGAGQRIYAPTRVEEVRDSYELGLGEMQIDLSQLDLAGGQDLDIDASMAVGSLQVVVPADVGVEAAATAQLGAVDVLGRTSEGTTAGTTFSEPGDEGSPTITLDLSTVMGEIEVHRAPDTTPETIPQAEAN